MQRDGSQGNSDYQSKLTWSLMKTIMILHPTKHTRVFFTCDLISQPQAGFTGEGACHPSLFWPFPVICVEAYAVA